MTKDKIEKAIEDMRPSHRHMLGAAVRIGESHEIAATVEEVIWPRNTITPLYLVQYWHEGRLMISRVHAEDCR